MVLDIRTVAFVTVYITLIIALVTVFVWRTRKTYAGFTRWTVGCVLTPVGTGLLGMRGVLPDWITIVVANSLTILIFILFLEGSREFRGLRPRLVAPYIGAAMAMLVAVYFRYAKDAMNIRIVVISLCLGMIALACAVTLLKDAKPGFNGMVFTGIVFVVVGAFDMIRAFYFLNHEPLPGLFAPYILNAVYFLNGCAASIGWSFGFLLSTNDRLVTEVQEAEARTVSANHELQASIEQANSLAARASEADAAKSEFLAHMSHEIRTPMNGILGMMQVALDSAPSADQRECLNIARNSAESLMMLLNDILDLSRIEAGKLSVEAVPFKPRELVEEAVKLLEVTARAKNLHIGTTVSDNVPEWVIADPFRVRQVLLNLLGNAIKFTDFGHIDIALDVSGPPEKLRIKVSDTGVGVPLDKQKSIFEAFTQADGSITRKYGGVGLGLAITSRLLKLMNGSIALHSKPGEGSLFELQIPYASPAEQPETLAPRTMMPQPELDSMRILVVEDNAINQKLAVRLLEGCGHTITLASNGWEAVSWFERGSFDLVLMDVQMPELDGLQATAMIREREIGHGSHIPIIAMTAHAMSGDRERCLRAGMDGYVTKPISIAVLLREIEAVMRTSALTV